MTESAAVAIHEATNPETGEKLEVAVIPDGYVALLMTREEAEKYAEWRECAAVRITVDGDTIAALEVCDDLDWLTSPEAEK